MEYGFEFGVISVVFVMQQKGLIVQVNEINKKGEQVSYCIYMNDINSNVLYHFLLISFYICVNVQVMYGFEYIINQAMFHGFKGVHTIILFSFCFITGLFLFPISLLDLLSEPKQRTFDYILFGLQVTTLQYKAQQEQVLTDLRLPLII